MKFSLLTNAIKVLPDLALSPSVISLLKMLPSHRPSSHGISSVLLPEGLDISVLSYLRFLPQTLALLLPSDLMSPPQRDFLLSFTLLSPPPVTL